MFKKLQIVCFALLSFVLVIAACGGNEWDNRLDKYESYVDDMIELSKDLDAEDLDEAEEEKLYDKMDEIESNFKKLREELKDGEKDKENAMTPEQMERFLKITEKYREAL